MEYKLYRDTIEGIYENAVGHGREKPDHEIPCSEFLDIRKGDERSFVNYIKTQCDASGIPCHVLKAVDSNGKKPDTYLVYTSDGNGSYAWIEAWDKDCIGIHESPYIAFLLEEMAFDWKCDGYGEGTHWEPFATQGEYGGYANR